MPFAFGDNEVDGCQCPALQAGYHPAFDDSCAAAESFDGEVRLMLGDDEGTVDEETAKEAWLRGLDYIEERVEGDNFYTDNDLRIGREIARELGWLDDE